MTPDTLLSYCCDVSADGGVCCCDETMERTMHPSTEAMLKNFQYGHLPEKLQKVSKPICDMALEFAETLEGPELTAGLRKLLEAKDCMVRAALT